MTAYVINNPDMANNIGKYIAPEDFVTDFNRRVYETVTERIQGEQSGEHDGFIPGFFRAGDGPHCLACYIRPR